MRKKLLKLYTEKPKEFEKLVKFLYGDGESGLQAVLQNKYKPTEEYYLVDGHLVGFDSIVADVNEIVQNHEVFKKLKLI